MKFVRMTGFAHYEEDWFRPHYEGSSHYGTSKWLVTSFRGAI